MQNFDNPIRRIDHIDIITQPEDGLCGQTCVAMLAGVTIAEVISVMDCREWQATMGRVISALNYYGIDPTAMSSYHQKEREATLPKCCIMMEKMGRYCHYLIHFDGQFYDSNLGILNEYDTSKVIGLSGSEGKLVNSSSSRVCYVKMSRSKAPTLIPTDCFVLQTPVSGSAPVYGSLIFISLFYYHSAWLYPVT